MRKLLLSAIMALAVSPAFSQVTLGYADEITSGWGDRNCVVTPYISFSKAMLEPYKESSIVSVNIGLMEDASNCYLYIKNNANDNGNLYRQKLDDLKAGWNEIVLEEPFLITGDQDLAIGYKGSFTNAGGVGISDDSFTEADIVYYNSNNTWTTTGGSICINAVIDGDNLPVNEIGIFKLSEDKSQSSEYDRFYNLYARNMGNNIVDNCVIEVLLDEQPIEDLQLEGIGKNKKKPFSFKVSSDVPGNHVVKVNVKSVNGKEDIYAYNNSLSTTFNILDSRFIANVVCEEYTGTWCGWCPRGLEGLEMMKNKYPGRFLAVSIHMNDDLEIDPLSDYSYRAEIDKVAGAPYCNVNRKYSGDPFDDIQNLYNLSTAAPVHLAISARATIDNENLITVTGEIISDTDLKNCEYNIAFPLTEDGVTGYYQTNYYSGVDYEFFGWESKDPITTDVVFNDVARAIIGGVNGMSLFKGDLKAFEPYEFEYSFNVPSNVRDVSKLNVIAQVMDPANSFIVNSTGVSLKNSGVASIADSEKVTLKVVNNEIIILNNGTEECSVSVYDISGSPCRNGKLSDRFSVSLEGGIYLVTVTDRSGKMKTWKVRI